MREKIYLGYENWNMHIMYSFVLYMLRIKRKEQEIVLFIGHNMHNNLPFPVSVTGSNRW